MSGDLIISNDSQELDERLSALFKQGKHAEGIELLRQARAKRSALIYGEEEVKRDPVGQSYRAHALRTLGRYEEAMEYYNKALNSVPADFLEFDNDLAVLVGRGLCFAALKDQSQAEADWLLAISRRIQEPFVYAHYYQGLAYKYLELFDQALASFNRALKEEKSVELQLSRAAVLDKLARKDEAKEIRKEVYAMFDEIAFQLKEPMFSESLLSVVGIWE